MKVTVKDFKEWADSTFLTYASRTIKVQGRTRNVVFKTNLCGDYEVTTGGALSYIGRDLDKAIKIYNDR